MAIKKKLIVILLTIFALCMVFLMRSVIHAYRIPSGSMEDTILVGDYIVANQAAYGLISPIKKNPIGPRMSPLRGDVVVFKYPKNPKKIFLQRVVGLPGETIEFQKDTVLINGKQLSEPYAIYKEEFRGIIPDDLGTIKIPLNTYFLMGDNRLNSKDSRAHGPINRDLIFGKALYIYFSFDAEEKRIRWNRINRSIR